MELGESERDVCQLIIIFLLELYIYFVLKSKFDAKKTKTSIILSMERIAWYFYVGKNPVESGKYNCEQSV